MGVGGGVSPPGMGGRTGHSLCLGHPTPPFFIGFTLSWDRIVASQFEVGKLSAFSVILCVIILFLFYAVLGNHEI